ncbi:MAG: hypothetical protein R2795_07970 [Saprospiraceae bacterium]
MAEMLPLCKNIIRGSEFFNHKAFIFMQTQFYHIKPNVMGVDLMRQQLMERIQLGDEQLIRVMYAVSEALKDADYSFDRAAYEASLKPMTVEELVARSRASDEDIAAGRIYSREEVETALGL